MNIIDFHKYKIEKKKLSMVTAYDYWSARIIDQTEIDCVLVGDSAAMVMHGHTSTLPATTEMMAAHVQAVARGLTKKFLIADMPFLSFRKGIKEAMDCVEAVMQAGAQAVKLEGIVGHEDVVKQIVQSGVPVMGHLGLTPQSIHQLGGFRVQGRDVNSAELLISAAHILEQLGCFSVVLECVPNELAAKATELLHIPTIGIGAGPNVDGQVLVLQDLLGLNAGFKPKFLRTYMNGFEQIHTALNKYNTDVKSGAFPTAEESYS